MSNGESRYNDDDIEVLESPSGPIVPDLRENPVRPDPTFADSRWFIPERETELVIYEWGQADDIWVEHRPDGRKRVYGTCEQVLSDCDPKLVRNELGTFSWLLAVELDPYGNYVSYSYHFEADAQRSGAALWDPQRRPLLRSVQWGGALDSSGDLFNYPHVVVPPLFELKTAVTDKPYGGSVLPKTTSYLRGGVQGGYVYSSFLVCGPAPTIHGHLQGIKATCLTPSSGPYWQYEMAYEESDDSGRPLLVTVTKKEATESGTPVVRTWKFEYSANGGTISFSDVPQQLRDYVYSKFETASPENILEEQAVDQPDSTGGTQFLDIDGDGRTDGIYHAAI